jgi:hypothetical protein
MIQYLNKEDVLFLEYNDIFNENINKVFDFLNIKNEESYKEIKNKMSTISLFRPEKKEYSEKIKHIIEK